MPIAIYEQTTSRPWKAWPACRINLSARTMVRSAPGSRDEAGAGQDKVSFDAEDEKDKGIQDRDRRTKAAPHP